MAVDQPKTIDIVSKDNDGFVLTICDHLDWNNTQEHLTILQDKINTYLAFLESGEIYENYPDAKGRPLQIEIMFNYRPNLEADAFLLKVKLIIEDAGFTFRFDRLLPLPAWNSSQ